MQFSAESSPFGAQLGRREMRLGLGRLWSKAQGWRSEVREAVAAGQQHVVIAAVTVVRQVDIAVLDVAVVFPAAPARFDRAASDNAAAGLGFAVGDGVLAQLSQAVGHPAHERPGRVSSIGLQVA
jgi:hypothetical protein